MVVAADSDRLALRRVLPLMLCDMNFSSSSLDFVLLEKSDPNRDNSCHISLASDRWFLDVSDGTVRDRR